MLKKVSIVALAAFAATASVAFGQNELVIYPNKGQGQQQMEKDKYDCYSWAKQQTGFDPTELPPTQASKEQQGSEAKGAARGAAIGGIGGDVAKGAARGTAIGLIVKRAKSKKAAKAEQQQTADYEAKRTEYDRAYGACLEGRGYTVK